MAAVSDLEDRLDAELAAVNKRVEGMRDEAARIHEKRQERYASFAKLAAELAEKIGKPKLEALLKRFPDATSTRLETRHGRGVRLDFDSDLARVALELVIHPVDDTDDFILSYDLSVLPIFIEFERHSELRQPVAAVDVDAVGRWLDDRLVAFAKTYFEIQFTEPYQRRHLAVDPVAGIRFPISFAVGSMKHGSGEYHFLSEQTKAEFERHPDAYIGVKAKDKG